MAVYLSKMAATMVGPTATAEMDTIHTMQSDDC